MKVRMLVVHYSESYEGEHAPNVMLAADEFILEENPAWWEEAKAAEQAKAGDEAAAWAEITIEVPMDRLMDALYPARTPIPGTVVADA